MIEIRSRLRLFVAIGLASASLLALLACGQAAAGPPPGPLPPTGSLCGGGCALSGGLTFTVDEQWCAEDEGQEVHLHGEAQVDATFDPQSGLWSEGFPGSFEGSWGYPSPPCLGLVGSDSGSGGGTLAFASLEWAEVAPPEGGEAWEMLLDFEGTGTDFCSSGTEAAEVDVILALPVSFSAAGTAHVDATLPFVIEGRTSPDGSYSAAVAGGCLAISNHATVHVGGDLVLRPASPAPPVSGGPGPGSAAPVSGGGAATPPAMPPDTRLRKKTVAGRTATFGFDGVGAPVDGFQCRLDHGKFRPCASPRTYRRLKPGKHAFAVRALAHGVPDPTPAKARFAVARTRRPAGTAERIAMAGRGGRGGGGGGAAIAAMIRVHNTIAQEAADEFNDSFTPLTNYDVEAEECRVVEDSSGDARETAEPALREGAARQVKLVEDVYLDFNRSVHRWRSVLDSLGRSLPPAGRRKLASLAGRLEDAYEDHGQEFFHMKGIWVAMEAVRCDAADAERRAMEAAGSGAWAAEAAVLRQAAALFGVKQKVKFQLGPYV
jgi:hypothetical protein